MTQSSRGRLLIVDDEISMMKALCLTLAEEGYVVTGATSGAEAISALHHSDHDLLLTDLVMPKMDGIALLREASAIRPDLVGVLMTGHGSIPNAVEAMKTGAIDYVLKPVKLHSLLPILERALSIRGLRRENAELQRRVRERTAELEAANEQLEAYSTSISHDLRTPLRAVSGFIDILLAAHASGMSPEVSRYIDLIRTGTNEMNELITHLLVFSQVARQPLAREAVDLEMLFREAYATLLPENSDHVIQFKLHPLPMVLGDTTLLRQVVVNLLSNAIKYSRTRAPAVIEVGVQAQPPTGEFHFFVRDNGVGFEMSDAGKLFTIFQRLHHAREFEGMGVGLATVRKIIERHGGRIWPESSRDVGATFWFTLPVDSLPRP